MAQFTLKINMDNAAFENNSTGEVSRILAGLVARMDNGTDVAAATGPETLRDVNGNRVGEWEVSA